MCRNKLEERIFAKYKRNISTIVVSPPIRLYNNIEYTQSLAVMAGEPSDNENLKKVG